MILGGTATGGGSTIVSEGSMSLHEVPKREPEAPWSVTMGSRTITELSRSVIECSNCVPGGARNVAEVPGIIPWQLISSLALLNSVTLREQYEYDVQPIRIITSLRGKN